MRVSEAMSAAGLNVAGEPIQESWCVATCHVCHAENRLSESETRDSGEQTEYRCSHCGHIFVIVGPAPGLTGGYRLKDNVVDPLGSLRIEVTPTPDP